MASAPRKTRRSAQAGKKLRRFLLAGGAAGLGLIGAVIMLRRPAAEPAPAAPTAQAAGETPAQANAELSMAAVGQADRAVQHIANLRHEAGQTAARTPGEEAPQGDSQSQANRQTVQALETFIEKGLEQLRTMPPQQRQVMVQWATVKAQELRTNFQNLPETDKAMWRKHAHSPDVQAWIANMSGKFIYDLNAEERQALAPVAKEWVDFVNNL